MRRCPNEVALGQLHSAIWNRNFRDVIVCRPKQTHVLFYPVTSSTQFGCWKVNQAWLNWLLRWTIISTIYWRPCTSWSSTWTTMILPWTTLSRKRCEKWGWGLFWNRLQSRLPSLQNDKEFVALLLEVLSKKIIDPRYSRWISALFPEVTFPLVTHGIRIQSYSQDSARHYDNCISLADLIHSDHNVQR